MRGKKRHEKTKVIEKNSKKNKLVQVCSCFVWFAAVFLFIASMILLPGDDNAFWILGFIGSFFVGFSLFIVVAGAEPKALGVKFLPGLFFASLFFGLFLVAISCIFRYVPFAYNALDKPAVSRYFICWGCLFFCALIYVIFRLQVSAWVRQQGVSKTTVKKLLKGKRNYWWYQSVHKEHSLGVLYYLNLALTIIWPVAMFLNAILGWWKPVQKGIASIVGVCLMISAAAMIISAERTGFSFLWEKSTDAKKHTGTISTLSYIALFLCICYLAIKLFTGSI